MGACELAAQVRRLVAGEEWRPLGRSQKVAGSVVELQRLLNVSGGGEVHIGWLLVRGAGNECLARSASPPLTAAWSEWWW